MTPLDLARAARGLGVPAVLYCHAYDLERVELGIEIAARLVALPSLRAEVWNGASPGCVILRPDVGARRVPAGGSA